MVKFPLAVLATVLTIIGSRIGAQQDPPAKVSNSLFEAIRNGNLAVVQAFMPIISDTMLEEVALNLATSLEKVNIVQFLLDNGGNPNATDTRDGGKHPLHHAAENGNLELIHMLIRYGAGIDCGSSTSGLTPLISAVMSDSVNAMRLLLDYGADINKTDSFGNSPLHYAIGLGNVEMVLVLLGRQAAVDPKRDLYHAASIANVSQRIVAALLDKRAEINAADRIGRTPLYYAVRYRDASLVRMLLQRGADPNKDMNGCNSPLYVAVTLFSGIEVVQELVDYGAHYYDMDCTGRTPLQIAQETKSMQPEVAQLLHDVAVGQYAVTGYTLAPANSLVRCGCCDSRYKISTPDIRVDKRQGILRFEYVKDDPDLNIITLHFSINRPLVGLRAGDFNVMLEATSLRGFNSPPTFRFASDFPVSPGDVINYWILALLDGRGYAQLTDQRWMYGDDNRVYYPEQYRTFAVTRQPYRLTTTTSTTTTTTTTTRPTTTTSSTTTTSTVPTTTLPREDIYLNLTWFFG